MAVEEQFAERIRAAFDALGLSEPVREQRMFGGLAWMVAGNMAVATSADDLMVRVGPDGMSDALALPHSGPMVMGERTMGGFVLVDPPGLASDADLHAWIERGVAFARSLPPK